MKDKLHSKELKEFIENHCVIYIRHSLLSTPKVYQKLISGGVVAVHYTERLKNGVDPENLENHENPDNYENNARNVLKRLNYYCEEGAIVFADYSDPPDDTGQKAANIGIILEGERYKAVRYPAGFIYKQVELCNYKTLAYADFAPFLAIHPRGGTVIRWWDAEKAVKFIYERELGLSIDPESINVEVLFPAQQEVLCSEYLRTKGPNEIRLKHLLLPIGRGMKTIDIDGTNDTTRLFAQVSFSKNEKKIEEKVNDLKNLAKEYHGSKSLVQLYFGPKDIEEFVHQIAPHIKFVSLEGVFNAMRHTGIVDDMLGEKWSLKE